MESSRARTAPRTALSAVTDARVAAADILTDLRSGDLLDASFDRRTEGLESRDRRWVHEVVYGTLRRRGWIDSLLAPRVRGGLVRLDNDLVDVLRLGVYQLLYMSSVPTYAAIAQTVELAKRRHGLGASKLANAVLRRVDREHASAESDAGSGSGNSVESLALSYSHPTWLVERWVGRYGIANAARLLAWNNEEPPLTLRPFRIGPEELLRSLEESGVKAELAPLVGDSVRLTEGVMLTSLGAYRQGLFFVQDPGATLVTRYAAIDAGSVVADLCAAPGGKSLELSHVASFIAAGDRSVTRLARMRANLTRLGVPNVALVAMDAREPAVSAVDAVLLDVPCTGTGTFRRHPDARWRLRISDLAVLTAMQRTILDAAAPLVRPGGLLIYSTCSLEPEENDEQIDRFLQDRSGWSLEPPSNTDFPDAVLDNGRLRVLPHRHGADGAFAARLRKEVA